MKCNILIFICLLLIFIYGCKVRPKNSEPSVRIYFVAAKVDTKKEFCFDDISDTKGKHWSTCIDSINNFIDIPLNLNDNTISIVFFKNKKYDTLSLEYQIKVEYKDGEFDSKTADFKIVKSSFDSLSTQTRHTKILNTNVKESISIYY